MYEGSTAPVAQQHEQPPENKACSVSLMVDPDALRMGQKQQMYLLANIYDMAYIQDLRVDVWQYQQLGNARGWVLCVYGPLTGVNNFRRWFCEQRLPELQRAKDTKDFIDQRIAENATIQKQHETKPVVKYEHDQCAGFALTCF